MLDSTVDVLTWTSTTSLGQSWWTVGCVLATLAKLYFLTWEKYYTGAFPHEYVSGPAGVYMISGYFGNLYSFCLQD